MVGVRNDVWENDPDPRPEGWSREGRQLAVVDARGNAAAFTGPQASAWAGEGAIAG